MLTACDVHRIGVVGGGVMGVGIAEVCADAGLDVRVVVSRPASLDAARRRLDKSMRYRLDKGMITERRRDEALARIDFSVELGELADRQLVVEAVTEDVEMKLDIFAALDKIVEEPVAIFASTTSSIPIVRLAQATTRSSQVIGLHFFSPVPVMSLVEVVDSLLTDERTHQVATAFVTEVLGKQAITAPDRAGFVVNALLVPYLLGAVRMVETGMATAEAVDTAMRLGIGHPMGPLRLADLVGLDLLLSVSTVLHEEFGEPQYAPPPLLRRMVQAGRIGKKSGCGFHDYTGGAGR